MTSDPGSDPPAADGRVACVELVRRYRTGPGQEVLALDGVDVTVGPGEMLAVTGPSGSGKSTLLHLIGAMDAPTSGTIQVGGTRVDRLRGRELDGYRRSIGFLFQRFYLLPTLSALDNVIVPVLPRRVGFNRRERAAGLLQAVGLAGRTQHLPAMLSGGEQQRVALARALVNNPRLLLADEPTGDLDSKTGAEIVDLIDELRGRLGMTVLVATHDPDVADRCDRRILLADGRIAGG